MTTQVNQVNQVIKSAYIDIHTDSIVMIPELVEYSNVHFGILQIEIADTNETKKPQDILFTIDISGSMKDQCRDKKTKIQHAIHTTKNIISVFEKSANKDIQIEIIGFDDNIEKVLPWTIINSENVDVIKEQINKLEPRGSTDIELALKTAIKSFDKQENQNQNQNQKTHIFLTDGNSTKGEDNPTILRSIVEQDQSINNIFIGFGKDHNAYLLQTLASKKDSYYFVDEIEHTGFVFGEIIHSILYKALENIELIIKNGEIYDYITNTWSNKLQISSLSSEAKKTYHVRTTTPETISATITSSSSSSFEEITRLPSLLNEDGTVEPTNLTKYMLRQKTQEFLYNAREIEIEIEYTEEYETRVQTIQITQNKQQIKKEIKEFMNHLNLYMNTNDVADDDFHNRLYADLCVAYKSINNPNGVMFLGSRQHSQGRESSYTPCINLSHDYDDDDDYNDYENSKNKKIPLLNHSSTTLSQIKIMNELMKNENHPQQTQTQTQTQFSVPKNTRKSPSQPRLQRTETIRILPSSKSPSPPLFPKELLIDTNIYNFAPPLTEYDKHIFSKKTTPNSPPIQG
jgi:Mg-chelatase subunit ChlD